MAESKEENLLRQKEEFERAAQETFNRILAAYRLVIDGISDDSFDEVNKIISNEINKTFEKAGNTFKEYLFDVIKEKFTKIWRDRDMSSHISMLEIGKKYYMTEEKWRPTGKTAEEQMRPHVYKMLVQQRNILKQLVDDQNNKIAELIPMIEERRKLFESRIRQREDVKAAIQHDMQSMKDLSSQVDEVLSQLNNFKQ